MSIADKLTKIAETEKKVYDAGRDKGYKDHYDLFWDTIQNNGGAANYNSTFYLWTYPWVSFDKLYVPKYDFIHDATPNGTFRECHVKDVFKDNYFDYKTSLTLLYTFYQSTRLENARTLHVNEGTKYTETFGGCSGLKEIRFAGTIGQNGLSFKDSTKLSRASIESVIEHLSSTTNGLKLTLSKTAVNKVFATSNGANDGSTSAVWTTLVASKSNWTIALA